jgi:outer membrane protein insertion porin family
LVAEVRIKGAGNIPVSRITKHIETRAGREFQPEQVDKDVRALSRTHMFHTVRTYVRQEPQGLVVVFEVVERPTIRYVAFVGNEKVKDRHLTKEVGIKRGDSLDPYAVEEGRQKIIDHYRNKGFGTVQVEILEGDRPSDRGVAYIINEGKKLRISWTSFSGNTVADDSRLRTQVETKPGILWVFKGYFDRETLNGDVDRITEYYRALGYFDAVVGREYTVSDGGWVGVTFVVEEGMRYRVDKISFAHGNKVSDEVLAETIKLERGEYFDQRKMNFDKQAIQNIFGDRGYAFADVQEVIRHHEEPGTLDVIYRVDEGARYHIAGITVKVTGESPHTRHAAVLNRLGQREGDIFKLSEIKDSERRIRASGIFNANPAQGGVPTITYTPKSEDFESLAERGGDSFRGQSPESAPKPARVTTRRGFRAPTATASGDAHHTARRPLSPTATRPNDDSAAVNHTADDEVPLVRGQYSGYSGTTLPNRSQGSYTTTTAPAQAAPVTTAPINRAAPTAAYPSYPVPGVVAAGGGAPGPSYAAPAQSVLSPSASPYQVQQQVTPSAYSPTPPPGTSDYGAAPQYGAAPAFDPTAPVAASGVTPPPGTGFGGPGELFPPGGYDYTPLEPTEPLDLVITAPETQTGRFMFGVGVNSEAGLLGNIMLEEQNFDWRRPPRSWEEVRNGTAWRGGGQVFRIEAVPGTEVQRYMFNFTEPYFFDSLVSLGLSAFYFDRRYDNWDEQRLGGRVSLGYQIAQDWSVTGSFRGENVNVRDPSVPTPPQVTDVLGDNSLFGTKLALTNDTRDSRFLPTEGHRVELSGEYVFGSYEYPRAGIEASQHFLLHQRPDTSGRHVLSMSTQVGFTGPNTPVYDNYYAGGFSTLRGWDFRGASPRVFNVPVGGEFMWVNSVEYMFPLTASDAVRGVAFCDFGTVEEDVRLDGDTFRLAPGFGLRVTVPALGAAPIALDFAFPILEADGDDNRVFSFFVGFSRF